MLIGRQKVENCERCPFCKPSVHATRLYSFCTQGGFAPQTQPPVEIPANCPFEIEGVQRAFQMVALVDQVTAGQVRG